MKPSRGGANVNKRLVKLFRRWLIDQPKSEERVTKAREAFRKPKCKKQKGA